MSRYSIQIVDAHAGGDVSRIVVGGVACPPGESLLEQLNYLKDEADGLRRLLLHEPYGDPAMSVNLVVPSVNPGAEAGFITMEAMGYPYFSGSNTLCTAAVLLEERASEQGSGAGSICLETPDGLVRIEAEYRDGVVWSVTCRGTPAYVVEEGLQVDLSVYGRVNFDLVFSGALYAVVRSEDFGFTLAREEEPRLINFASELIQRARPLCEHRHPHLGKLAPLPFVHFEGPEAAGDDGNPCSPTATYVHPGVVCRSPTGTGTAARLALRHHQGRMLVGDALHTVSPRGNEFTGRIVEELDIGNFRGIRCTTTGRAFTLAHSTLRIDLDDPHVPREGLRTLLE